MKKAFYFILCISFSCASTKKTTATTANKHKIDLVEITEISNDPKYGYSPKKPIEVGELSTASGPTNERKYLNLLTGPNGEQVSYYRVGSGWPIKSKNSPFGSAVLDRYYVTWENSKDTISLYLNMYDGGELKAPKGFGIKSKQIQFLQQ